jgi:four helix bundle protein
MPAFELCQRTFDFSLAILQLWQKINRRANFPRPLANQLLRAGTSIGANVEEGQGGQSRADFVSKYSIARKDARETRYWLRLFVASNLVDSSEGQPLVKEADELVYILTAISRKAKSV